MIKLPELREKIAMASMNLESICEARDDNAKVAEIDSQIEAVNQILSLYPFNGEGWFYSGDSRYCVMVYDSINLLKDNIKKYYECLKNYDLSFGTTYSKDKTPKSKERLNFIKYVTSADTQSGRTYAHYEVGAETTNTSDFELDEIGGFKVQFKNSKIITDFREKNDPRYAHYVQTIFNNKELLKRLIDTLGADNYSIGNFYVFFYYGTNRSDDESVINKIADSINILEEQKKDLEKEQIIEDAKDKVDEILKLLNKADSKKLIIRQLL